MSDSAAQKFYENGLGRNYWCDRLARRVKPSDMDSFRADVWRALVDWGWGIELHTPYRRRVLWVYRRLTPSWMPKFYPRRDG